MFYCIETWQLRDASPTNYREGDKTKETNNTTQHRAAETESELKEVTKLMNEQESESTIVTKSPSIGTPNQVIPFPDSSFLHFINLSHSSSAKVLTRRLIGT